MRTSVYRQKSICFIHPSCFMFVVMFLIHWTTLKHFGEQHKVINDLIDMAETARQPGSGSGDRQGGGMTIYIVTMVTVMSVIGRSLKVLKRPESPELWSSLASDPKSLHPLVKLAICLSYAVVIEFNFYFTNLHFFIILLYVASILPAIEKLRLHDASGEAGEECPSVEEISKQQIKLAILEKKFMSVYCLAPLVLQLLTLLILIANYFLVTVFLEPRYVIFVIVFTTFFGNMLHKSAEVHSTSEDVLRSWREVGMGGRSRIPKQHLPWFSRFAKSCCPLKVDIGNFFYIDKGLILTTFSIIVNNVTSLIVAYKESRHN